jgi:hypothetical protein
VAVNLEVDKNPSPLILNNFQFSILISNQPIKFRKKYPYFGVA